jgi:hypothetical protein
MRLIDHFDRGADLHPDRHGLHDGARGWTCENAHARSRPASRERKI